MKSFFFFLIFYLDQGPFFGATDCSCYGFQIQSGYLACTLSCLHAVILKVTSGVTPAFSTNRGVHCISVYTAWRPVTFPTCHVCNRGRLPGFDQETSRTVSRRALHSATATGFKREKLATSSIRRAQFPLLADMHHYPFHPATNAKFCSK